MIDPAVRRYGDVVTSGHRRPVISRATLAESTARHPLSAPFLTNMQGLAGNASTGTHLTRSTAIQRSGEEPTADPDTKPAEPAATSQEQEAMAANSERFPRTYFWLPYIATFEGEDRDHLLMVRRVAQWQREAGRTPTGVVDEQILEYAITHFSYSRFSLRHQVATSALVELHGGPELRWVTAEGEQEDLVCPPDAWIIVRCKSDGRPRAALGKIATTHAEYELFRAELLRQVQICMTPALPETDLVA